MAVIVIGRKFTDDQGRELNFPFFSGYDRVKLMYTVNIAFSYTINTANPIEKLGDQLTLLNGNSWEDYGFVEGAEITGNIGGVAIPSSTEINFIDGALMELNNTLTGTDGTYNTGSLKLVQVPDAINFDFNLVENTSTGNEYSVIDGEVNRFTCDVSALTPGDNTTPTQLGNKSGGSNFLTDVKRIADSANGNKQYEISITFNPWTIKDPSLYFSNACVKPWARISALAEFNNPSVFISAVNTFTDANTGLIDEVGNGGVPAYTLTSIDIETINLNAETEFEIRIDGAFDGDSIFNIALYYDAQDEADYKNLSTDFDQNTIMLTSDVGLAVDDTYNLVSATRPDGVSIEIQDLTVTGSTTYAIFTGKIVPNEAFKNFMLSKSSDNRNFKFWIRCEDYTLTGNEINPVWVKCLEGSFNDLFIPLGSYDLAPNIYDHADFRLWSPTVFVEDDVRAETAFEIPKNSDWERITSGIRVVNSVTGEQFDLESFTVDLTTLPTLPDGSIPVDLAIVRPFNLSPDNRNSVVEFKRKPIMDDEDNYGVEIIYSALMRWEYWLQQLGTALDFYGNSTKDWVEYFTGDWTLNYFIDLQTPIGVYSDNFAFTLKDYDDWDGTQTVEYFRASDDTPITKPLIGEDTKVRFTFTDTGSLTLGDRWGQITVESFENAPRWDISSVWGWDNVTANPLKPLTGETGCKITISGANCVLECLLDVTKLPNPNKVSLTGRFYVEKEGALTRHKVTVLPVRLPKDPTIQDRGNTGNCCDCIYEVFADLNSEDTYRNHVSSRWIIGENVEFRLYKNGALTSFEPTTQAFPNDTNAKYCTIPWRDVLNSDGRGCYVLKALTESAGIETEITLGTFKLEDFDWSRLVDKICIRSIFNDANLKEGINFTNANVQDCIVIDGDVEEYQPNTEINNLVKADFTQVKTKRENRTKWSVNINFADFCHLKRLTDLHLVGENFLFISDYRQDAFDKTLLDKAVILSDSMQLTPIYRSERQKGSFQVEEKIVNHVTKYGAVGASGKVEASEFPLPNVVNGDCDPAIVTINDIEVGTVECNETLELTLVDQNSDLVPFTQDGNELTVNIGGGGTNSAPLMKTGQTTSYRTGDDGDIQAGRDVDFFTLDFVNHFGNNKRFTGITGGYYDRADNQYKDVNGTVTTRSGAYPTSLRIDWSTFNPVTGEVLMWYFSTDYLIDTWDNSLDNYIPSFSFGGFTDWKMANFNELMSITYHNNEYFYNYVENFPLNFPVNIWTSTSVNGTNATTINNNRTVGEINKASNGVLLIINRIANISEL